MPIVNEYRKIFQQLMQDSVAQITVGGINITIRIYDNARKFSLVTEVYFGGNFIPKSVRDCISKQPKFSKESPKDLIKTYPTMDEKNFRIYLNYLGLLEGMNNESFRVVLEEFSWLAEEWRLFLDENDKHDLIYVRVKS